MLVSLSQIRFFCRKWIFTLPRTKLTQRVDRRLADTHKEKQWVYGKSWKGKSKGVDLTKKPKRHIVHTHEILKQ